MINAMRVESAKEGRGNLGRYFSGDSFINWCEELVGETYPDERTFTGTFFARLLAEIDALERSDMTQEARKAVERLKALELSINGPSYKMIRAAVGYSFDSFNQDSLDKVRSKLIDLIACGGTEAAEDYCIMVDSAGEADAEATRRLGLLKEIALTCGVDVEGKTPDRIKSDVVGEIEARIMPEGMQWPRFESGEPVKFGDAFASDDEANETETNTVDRITFDSWMGGRVTARLECNFANGMAGKGYLAWSSDSKRTAELDKGNRAKRPESKVLDADGVPIKVGDVVYARNGCECSVESVGDGRFSFRTSRRGTVVSNASHMYTHVKPEPPDTWERVEADACVDAEDYWDCDGYGCQSCPSKIDGELTKEHYRVNNCTAAKAADLVRRCKALAEGITK